MRAILIDPEKEEISEVLLDNADSDQIYSQIGCQSFQMIQLQKGNYLFIDEEGLLNNPKHYFTYKGWHQPLTGKGLILGPLDDDENTLDCNLTIDEVKQRVNFVRLSIKGFETTEGKTIHHGVKTNYIKTIPIFGPPEND